MDHILGRRLLSLLMFSLQRALCTGYCINFRANMFPSAGGGRAQHCEGSLAR
ncbi:MAG: hypothetical protein OSA92_00925 [Pirellulaceae bacterium]|nr:hypothetical protein [Pirellulaceae bacterium]